MMSKKLYILMTAIALTLCCCQNNDDFTAGPQASNTKGNVYFGSDYESLNIYGDQPTLEDTLWITVVRDSNDCANALNVPIERIADDKVIIPEQAEFDAGEDTTWLAITFPNVEFTKESKFTLTIPAEFADPYKEKNGSTTISSGVLWSEWTDVADTVLIVSSYNLFPNQGGKLQNLSGKNRFRITNFLGSGNPFEFSINTATGFNSKNLTDNAGSINPLKNFYSDTSCWYWTNDGDYSPWTPNGSSFEISYVSFYTSYGYDWLDLSVKNKTSFKISGKKYYYDYDAFCNSCELVYFWNTDTSKSSWDYIYFMVLYEDESE